MQGFVGFRIPIWLRRLVTMVPAFIVVGLGTNATMALVISQVVLSLVLPVPMVALLVLIRRPDVMARFAIGRGMQILAATATMVVLALNVILLLQTFAN
jgi:manganese transport protein